MNKKDYEPIRVWIEDGFKIKLPQIPDEIVEYLDWTNIKELFQKTSIKNTNIHRPILYFRNNIFTLHDESNAREISIKQFKNEISYTEDWKDKLQLKKVQQPKVYEPGKDPLLYDTRGT